MSAARSRESGLTSESALAGPSPPKTRKRKRPKVPAEQRQRVNVACGSCRRLKEKCDGNVPCQRCLRYSRPCEAPNILPPKPQDAASERVRHLETIARHFLGAVPLTDDSLRRIATNLETEHNVVGAAKHSSEDVTPALDDEQFTVKRVDQNTAHYSGEFSHWNFSQRVKKQVDKRLQEASLGNPVHSSVLDYWRVTHLKTRDTEQRHILENLPPKETALFLSAIYFRYAQTNTFFVEEAWVLEKIEALYTPNAVLVADDTPSLCTTLMVLAVGTQFANVTENAAVENAAQPGFDSAAEAVGVSIYQMAADLVPDIIAIASVDSVQAFLLLAHYALPLDAHGLAYTYLGLALKMAIQNGMHRKQSATDLDEESIDFRNRLWWTAYRLEKRVTILHGRPGSISSGDVDAEYPLDIPPTRQQSEKSRYLENTMTKLTEWLGDIAFVIHMLKKSPARLRHAYFERLHQVRRQYLDWWSHINIRLAGLVQCRRAAHLRLCHHLNLVYMGRPFMLSDRGSATGHVKESDRDKISVRWSELSREAVKSAEEIVKTCQSIRTTIGLAGASYVEFSSCRAAVLALSAHCLNDQSRAVRDVLAEGMQLINAMASANASTASEASLMASIVNAIGHLDHQKSSDETVEGAETLTNFKHWASQFQRNEDGTSGNTNVADTIDFQDAFDDFGWSPLDDALVDGGEAIDFEGLGMFHFDEAFSMAGGHESAPTRQGNG